VTRDARGALAALLLGGACFVCEGVGPVTAAEPTPPGGADLRVLLTTSELVVGRNRLGFGLARNDRLLADVAALVRVYDIREAQARLADEALAPYHPLEVVERGQRVHIHPDGSRHVHDGVTDVQGVYAAQVTFPRPGPWGLEVLARGADGVTESARLRVVVLEVPNAPLPGRPAPRSRNPIATDVKDLRTLDSSEPPDPRLHQTRIADAIAQGRPQVIVFATPKYCASRVCGPVVDVVRTLIPGYGDRVAFVHEEIWSGPTQEFTPTVQEWNLRSEPWIFLVDGQGVIRARFEGLTSRRELEAALTEMLRPR
jgi:hypothetical protein